MPSRSYQDVGYSKYRWGFNGKENDSDWEVQDYGFRIYKPEISKFLSVDPLTQSYPWYTPYQFAGNMPIWAVDLDGSEPLFQTSYKRLLEKKVEVTYGDEMIVKYTFRGQKIHARIDKNGVEATTLKSKVKSENGNWKGFAYAPYLAFNYDKAKAVEEFTHSKAWDGAPGGLFYTLSIQMTLQSKVSDKEKKEFDYENTFLHFAGQAITTMLFGESFTKYVADMHERKPSEGYQSIMIGAAAGDMDCFGKIYLQTGLTLEHLTVDQIKDVFNNEIGRIIGVELADKYGITSSTIWTNKLTTNVLNDIMSVFTSENPKMKFTPFNEKDEFVKKFTESINKTMSNYEEGY
jgi:RHS repeat-associated protein